jgi:hypothetical protein
MGTSLTGLTPATTYDALIKIGDNAPLDGTLKTLSDGLGNDLPLQISSTDATFTGNLNISRTIALSAGATNPSIENIAYTINNTGAQTGTATGILLNATETALNSQTHNLMDLQRAGVSNFKVGTFHNAGFRFNVGGGSNYRPLMTFSRIGDATSSLFFIGAGAGPTGTSSYLAANNDDMYFGTDISGSFTNNIILPASGVGRILLGGLTSSFPSIKRNGTAIDFRLADDSGFTQVNASSFKVGGTATELQVNLLLLGGFNVLQLSTRVYIDGDNRGVAINNNLSIGGGNVSANASSVLDLISTTKGFLPPRMTNSQRTSISSPAVGLMVYCTDAVEGLYVYKSTGWTLVI